jgi:hypothetical protein
MPGNHKMFKNNAWKRLKFIGSLLLVRFRRIAGSKIVLTCDGNHDGGGARIHACLTVIIFARAFNCKYAHTPLYSIEHRPESISESEWLASWESIFARFYAPAAWCEASNRLQSNFPKSTIKHALTGLNSRRTLSIANAHAFCDLFPIAFYLLPAPRAAAAKCLGLSNNSCKKTKHNVVVHLRRGDVDLEGSHSCRFTPLETISKALALAAEKHQGTFIITIFTEHCPPNEDFGALVYSITVNTTANVFEVINHMENADILIMAKSSLSYIGALLCQGAVYYEPFWHPPLPHWNVF